MPVAYVEIHSSLMSKGKDSLNQTESMSQFLLTGNRIFLFHFLKDSFSVVLNMSLPLIIDNSTCEGISIEILSFFSVDERPLSHSLDV
jgi:hypothetical protein